MDETLMISSWLWWLIAAAILVIAELLTNTFAAFCLVGGCALALVASLIGFGIEVQLVAAAIGSVVAFIAFKPLIRKQANSRLNRENLSNMDALVGRITVVDEPIAEHRPGRIIIDGDNWQAVSDDGTAMEKGTKVKVLGYDSIILTVTRAEE